MKVVETRNLYASYRVKETSSANIPREVHWVSMYIIKQLVRLIQIKQLKNAVSSVELWTPDSFIRQFEKLRKNYVRQGGNQNGRNNKHTRRK